MGGVEGAFPPGDFVTIEVADTGCGMEGATRARAFEPLFTTKPEGTGLGLPSVLATVRASSGGVTMWTEPGKGSRFTLYFPAVERAPAVPLASAHGC